MSPLSWPLLVEDEFVGLMEKNQPESLVVLAYYCVLLWEIRDIWYVWFFYINMYVFFLRRYLISSLLLLSSLLLILCRQVCFEMFPCFFLLQLRRRVEVDRRER